MRHLTVVNNHNEVVGVVTRKDLMGFSMVERLSHRIQEEMEQEERRQERSQELQSPVRERHAAADANVI